MFEIGKPVTFVEEPDSPYDVKVIGTRYAILTRPMAGGDREGFKWEGPVEKTLIYSIVDMDRRVRAPHDRVFNFYEFDKIEGCRKCLSDMESGEIELSRRRTIPVHLLE